MFSFNKKANRRIFKAINILLGKKKQIYADKLYEGLIFDFFQNPTVIPSWYEEMIILQEEVRKRSNFYSIQETP